MEQPPLSDCTYSEQVPTFAAAGGAGGVRRNCRRERNG
jgi:hypothetical protein